VKGAVVVAIDGIGTLLKVEVVKTLVAQTGDSGLGGGKSPVVTTIVEIEEFPEEVATFVSIVVCNTV
jgi:hypothetical protein